MKLPDAATQKELLEIYFAYVHPALPILHKQSFLEELHSGCVVRFPIFRVMCHPHLVALGTLSVDATAVLTHLLHCSTGEDDGGYPHCSCSQCSLSRLDIPLPMIMTGHRRKAQCGPLVMYISKTRSDFWTLPTLPLAQPHVRHCFLWAIAKSESVRWHRPGFMSVWPSAWLRTLAYTRTRINGCTVGRHCLLPSNYRSVAGSGMLA